MSLDDSGDGNRVPRELMDSSMIKQENGTSPPINHQNNSDTTALTPKSNASGEKIEGVVVKKEETQEPDYMQSYQPLPKEEAMRIPGIKYEDEGDLPEIVWSEWMKRTDTIRIPELNPQQKKRSHELSSLLWHEFYNNGDPTTHPEKEVLYRTFKIREAEISYIQEKLSSDEVKKNASKLKNWNRLYFESMISMAHVTLLGQDWGRAHAAFKLCHRLNKEAFGKDPGAYYGFGLVYYHFKKFKLAIEAFTTQLYLFPDSDLLPDIHCRLGSSYKHQEQYGLALKHYTAAYADQREAWFHSKTQLRICIALCHSLSGDLQKAYDDLKKLEVELALQLQSVPGGAVQGTLLTDRATVLRELGWVCYQFDSPPENRHQKLEEAERYLIQSRDLEPNHGKTYYYLGRCYGENKQRAHDAFLHYRQAIDKSEGDADTWSSIGLLYQDQNQPVDALQAFICAVELNPEHSPAWTNLGQLYLHQHRFHDALQCFKSALQHNPVCPAPLKQHIAILERELNISHSQGNRSVATGVKEQLPILQEAWKQPIPSELRQRQNESNLLKQFRYREGSPLWKMAELGVTRKRPKLEPLDQSEQDNPDEMNAEQAALYGILDMNKQLLDENSKNIHHQLLKLKKPNSERSAVSPMTMDDLPTNDDEYYPMHLASTSDAYTRLKHELDLQAAKEEEVENEEKPRLHRLPHKFSLMAPLRVKPESSAEEILSMASKRIECPEKYEPIFEEEVPPPEPPKAPQITVEEKTKFSKCPEAGYRQTPLITVDSRAEAQLTSLQQFLQSPKCSIASVRGLTSALRMDLSLFSTKTLMELIPDQTIEVRTQYRMRGDQNVNHAGDATWDFYSAPGSAKVIDYAQYQAQTFKFCLKEEEEKLRKNGAKYGQIVQESGKRGVMASEPLRQIKFGTNIDVSDGNRFPKQLKELQKLPGFCRPGGASDMLSHLGYTILGMNTVQMYMKVPQARTPAHIENNCFASVNINIGPGDCEWFAVPYEYWAEMKRLCDEHKIDFLRGSWWPDVDQLLREGIPVYRFTQKAGDVVWVGPGCVHWVQATGWCNNIAWNVGPLTSFQLEVSLISYEWNKKQLYNSLVPMQLLCWQLAKNIQFTIPSVWQMVRGVLIRSLAYCKMIAKYVESCGKVIKYQPRQSDPKGREPTCVICEVEVFNILFVKQENPDKADSVYFNYCVNCARKKKFHKDESFYVLQQITFDELIAIYDKCQLTFNSKKLNLVA